MNTRTLAVYLVVGAASWTQAGSEFFQANAGAGTNKTVITADHLTVDYRRNRAEFEKHVVVVDPQIRIESDKLVVDFDKENNIQTATASGTVKLWQADKTGSCRQAVYDAKTGEVRLIGDAALRRGRDTVKGDKITFSLNDDKMWVEGQPNLEIHSSKGTNAPAIGKDGKPRGAGAKEKPRP